MKDFIPKEHKGPRVIKSKSSNQLSDEYRDSIMISYQYLGEAINPDTTFRIGDYTASTPIMAGPVSMRTIENDAPELAYARAVHEAGSVFWSHFFGAENYEKLLAEGIPALRVLKPLSDMEEIIRNIRHDEECGAIGYAMDVDHIYSVYGKMEMSPAVCGSKTVDDIKRINEASSLPFFLKGIISVHDALIAKEAGVYGIVLSGHNNRFPCAAPPLRILPEIRKAVGDEMMILLDGGMNTGYDVFKALALGADGVLSARTLLGAMVKEGADGLTYKLQEMTAELKGAMAVTGSPDLRSINRSSLVF